MNPFNKNPFSNNNTNTHIVGNNIHFDEKKKLENIKENMTKLKFSKPIAEEQKKEETPLSVKDKINLLKNINR